MQQHEPSEVQRSLDRREFLRQGVLAPSLVGGAALLTGGLRAAEPVDEKTTVARRGMVVSVSAEASDVGRDILRRGGAAVDAAVATALALAVTYPEAGNIGGGGFMMIHAPGRRPECVEYRETAPAAATETMFRLDSNRYCHKAVGVPGTLRGLALAHSRHGKLAWRELVTPAVQLARDGFLLDDAVAHSLNEIIEKATDSPELIRVYGKAEGRETWRPGDRLTQAELAETLRLVAEQGADAFYRGPIADQLVAEMRRGGGLITRDDLAAYQAKIRRPIVGTFRGHRVFGPPPPSSGGVCLVEMLNILENFDLRASGRWSADAVHPVVESMRRAYCDRARSLGDPDFVDIPPHLTTKAYAKKLAAEIDRRHATPSERLAPDIQLAPEGADTTHFCVVDSDGMAVSNTYTLERSYGARVVVRGAGFLLNNEMGDFNWVPGHTDREGWIGTKPNRIAPGKRMLSSQTPVIVAHDDKPVLLTGSPGGRTIINTVLCVLLGVLEFGESLRRAVDQPRLSHTWLPDRLRFEGVELPKFRKLVERLEAMGHTLEPKRIRQGDAHSIQVRDGEYLGVADRRVSGRASGW